MARARWAEDRVAKWYAERGFDIIARNWSMRGGEIDVVARRRDLVVVCEVKARADESYGHPIEAVTDVKQQRVRRTAFAFIKSLGETGLRLRFDVACVLGNSLDVIEDAF